MQASKDVAYLLYSAPMSELYIKADLTVAVPTRLLIDKWVSRQRRRCLKLVMSIEPAICTEAVHLKCDHQVRYNYPCN